RGFTKAPEALVDASTAGHKLAMFRSHVGKRRKAFVFQFKDELFMIERYSDLDRCTSGNPKGNTLIAVHNLCAPTRRSLPVQHSTRQCCPFGRRPGGCTTGH